MSWFKRINNAYKSARRIPFNEDSKFIIFSDCHRGDNSFADDFANNRNTYFHALSHYYNQGFTYCELGDGDELWENVDFKSIFEAHKNVFMLMHKFHSENRLHRLVGNHDMAYKSERFVKKKLETYFNKIRGKDEPLFPGISFPEGLILQESNSNQEVFMLHGHQADWMNYNGWRFNQFLVRVLWRQLQIFGIGDPTSPAKNHKELLKVERRFKEWISSKDNLVTIIGHTHRPRFPEPNETALFNDGSCVHPRCITGLEIENGEISLIKWQVISSKDGTLKIERFLLEGPQKLSEYKNNIKN